MCANSCARIASICIVESPVRQLAGISTTGRSQPITVGACTNAECISRTARAIPSRRRTASKTCCNSAGAAVVPADLILRATSSPTFSRPTNRITPANHASRIHGSAWSSATAICTGQGALSSPALTRRTIPDSIATAGPSNAARNWYSTDARCANVTSGSAIISPSARHAAT